jgi:hypothetical protein
MILLLPVTATWMRVIAFIGKYSYSIYLFHGFVHFYALRRFSGWTYYGAYLRQAIPRRQDHYIAYRHCKADRPIAHILTQAFWRSSSTFFLVTLIRKDKYLPNSTRQQG